MLTIHLFYSRRYSTREFDKTVIIEDGAIVFPDKVARYYAPSWATDCAYKINNSNFNYVTFA